MKALSASVLPYKFMLGINIWINEGDGHRCLHVSVLDQALPWH